MVGGAALFSEDALQERLAFMQNAIGAVPGPMDCFLTHLGIKTLHLRMERAKRKFDPTMYEPVLPETH